MLLSGDNKHINQAKQSHSTKMKFLMPALAAAAAAAVVSP
jgi:hypothetical protein